MPDWKKLLDDASEQVGQGIKVAGKGLRSAADEARKVAGIGVGTIGVELGRSGYSLGDKITGIVRLKLTEPIRAARLVVVLEASRKRYVTQRGSDGRVSPVQRTETLINHEVEVAGERSYDSGSHRFTVHLPTKIDAKINERAGDPWSDGRPKHHQRRRDRFDRSDMPCPKIFGPERGGTSGLQPLPHTKDHQTNARPKDRIGIGQHDKGQRKGQHLNRNNPADAKAVNRPAGNEGRDDCRNRIKRHQGNECDQGPTFDLSQVNLLKEQGGAPCRCFRRLRHCRVRAADIALR